MRWFGAGLVLCAVIVTARNVESRGSAHLTYTQPAGDTTCPDEATLRGMIASQLGYDPFDIASSVRVHASIERASGRLRGRVALTRGGALVGERVLDAANDCPSVATALALTVAVAIDTLDPSGKPSPSPSVVVEGPSSGPAPASPEAPPPAQPPRASQADAPPRRDPVAFRASGGLKVSAGVAPAAAFGAAVAMGARWKVVSLNLEGRGDLPAFAPLSTGGELGTSAILGMLVPCAHLRRFVACGLLAAGSMRGESRGVQNPASDYGLFGAAGARIGFELPLSQWVALRPEVDGLVAWVRPELRLDDRAVWTVPPASGTLGLSLVIQLGENSSF